MSLPPVSSSGILIYFDGVCALCNRFVNELHLRDTECKLTFAPLQGSTAQSRLPAYLQQDHSSLIVERNDHFYTRGEAIAYICSELPRPPWHLKFLCALPVALRNLLYDGLARSRYFFFGNLQTCRYPDAETEKWILP